MDGDGDIDVVLASMFNDWKQPERHQPCVAGKRQSSEFFGMARSPPAPTHLCTVRCGDLNGDSLPDIVAGSLQIYPPYNNEHGAVAIWENQGVMQ